MTDTTADLLRKAKAHIGSPEMWFQGGHYSRHGHAGALRGEPCCAYGSLIWVTGAFDDKLTEADKTLSQVLVCESREDFGEHSDNVALFNDHPDTTHADIMALFDRAIAKAEAG